jgi:2-polyprenyl-3-methyl-5-hydroxy-6-metoxy-1,4-benzoquinol methylase
VSDERLRQLYGHNYFFGEEYTNYLADRRAIERNFRLRFRTLRRFINPERHRRLFEVGCAYGLFLNLVREHFEVVQGIDVSHEAVEYARKEFALDVIAGDLLRHDFKGTAYDVVCMWDTVEHLKRPDLYLQAVAQHMDAGSVIAITTGDIDSINARLQRERWRLIHPPTHLHYFSRASMEQLLNRLGFDVVSSDHCGFYRNIGSMIDGLTRGVRRNSTCLDWLKEGPLARSAIYLNLYDIMFVMAVKRPQSSSTS